MESTIFETHYKAYCRQIGEIDFTSIKNILGIDIHNQKAQILFMGDAYTISDKEITDSSGNLPDYMACVILSKYLLQCPEAEVVNKEWAALKDFHQTSQFTNLNLFISDVIRPIVKNFSGRVDALRDACKTLEGSPCELDASYDVAMAFTALPKIDILLLFNDGDDEFPASCSLLFQRQAESYLDPESLIMVGMFFTRQLIQLAMVA